MIYTGAFLRRGPGMDATYEIIPIIRNTVDTSGGELGMVVILRLMEKYVSPSYDAKSCLTELQPSE